MLCFALKLPQNLVNSRKRILLNTGSSGHQRTGWRTPEIYRKEVLTMGTFLTFTLDEDGSLVHVDDVSKGMKCGCHCPHCDAPLYAKNAGQIREHHFAHAHGHECEEDYCIFFISLYRASPFAVSRYFYLG